MTSRCSFRAITGHAATPGAGQRAAAARWPGGPRPAGAPCRHPVRPEHQIVGSVVAAKYRVFELQSLQQAFDLDEQGTPIQRLEIGEASTETLLAGRETHHQGRQVLRLGGVHQARGVVRVLRAQGHSAQTVEDHHRTTDPRLAKLFQRIQGRGIGLALVDPCQHFVVAGLGADIGHSQPGVGQFAQLLDRLPAQVARQAVAGYPLHLRQVLANRLQHREQPAGRQYQGVAIGEKHPLDDQALAAAADLLQYLVLVAGAKFLCGWVYISQKPHLFQEQPLVTGRISECASLGAGTPVQCSG